MTRVPGERRLGDRRDAPARDADMPHGVEARLRIDHAAVGDDEVVGRRRRSSRGTRREGGEAREHDGGAAQHAAHVTASEVPVAASTC